MLVVIGGIIARITAGVDKEIGELLAETAVQG